MTLHAEILPPDQQDVLRQLGRPATECGFYLGGGTAIAAHLGHRRSQDLDWFTHERIDDPLALARELQDRVQDISRVLYSLTYFDDTEGDPMPRMLETIAWEQVKGDIRTWVKAIAAGGLAGEYCIGHSASWATFSG